MCLIFLITILVSVFKWRRRAAGRRGRGRQLPVLQVNQNDDLWKRLKRPSVVPRIQRTILLSARANKGIVTPSAVVSASKVSVRLTLAGAKKDLDQMVRDGDLELRITQSGPHPWSIRARVPNGRLPEATGRWQRDVTPSLRAASRSARVRL